VRRRPRAGWRCRAHRHTRRWRRRPLAGATAAATALHAQLGTRLRLNLLEVGAALPQHARHVRGVELQQQWARDIRHDLAHQRARRRRGTRVASQPQGGAAASDAHQLQPGPTRRLDRANARAALSDDGRRSRRRWDGHLLAYLLAARLARVLPEQRLQQRGALLGGGSAARAHNRHPRATVERNGDPRAALQPLERREIAATVLSESLLAL